MTEQGKAPAARVPKLQSMTADRDHWRKALCDVLQLVPLHFDDIENICIDRSPGGDIEKGEHPKDEWVAWDSEYPEDGSVSLNLLAAPPHLAAIPAGEAIKTLADTLEEARDVVDHAGGRFAGALLARIDAALRAAGRLGSAATAAEPPLKVVEIPAIPDSKG